MYQRRELKLKSVKISVQGPFKVFSTRDLSYIIKYFQMGICHTDIIRYSQMGNCHTCIIRYSQMGHELDGGVVPDLSQSALAWLPTQQHTASAPAFRRGILPVHQSRSQQQKHPIHDCPFLF